MRLPVNAMGPMDEAAVRAWTDLVHRLDGPLHLRFIVQPAMAVLLGVRAGIRDGRADETPFLVALWRGERRRERLQQAWSDIATVFVVAVVIDVAYQLWFQQGVYLGELILTGTLLALVPYALVRGPAHRVARCWLTHRGHRCARGL